MMRVVWRRARPQSGAVRTEHELRLHEAFPEPCNRTRMEGHNGDN